MATCWSPVASGRARSRLNPTAAPLSSGSTDHPLVTRGLYRQTGSTFTRIFTAPGPDFAVPTAVKVDPTHAGYIYVNSFQNGIWRSADNGATFSQIFVSQDPTVAAKRAWTDLSSPSTTLHSGATSDVRSRGAREGAPVTTFEFFLPQRQTPIARATFTSLGGIQVDNYLPAAPVLV